MPSRRRRCRKVEAEYTMAPRGSLGAARCVRVQVHGERTMPGLVAVVVPNYDTIGHWASANGLSAIATVCAQRHLAVCGKAEAVPLMLCCSAAHFRPGDIGNALPPPLSSRAPGQGCAGCERARQGAPT